ncbi:hypothetical protein NPIL_245201, partial [Nephila pilipes]
MDLFAPWEEEEKAGKLKEDRRRMEKKSRGIVDSIICHLTLIIICRGEERL